MKPYYEQDGITIYHGDCLGVLGDLPAKSVDLVVADPPYGLALADWDTYGLIDWFGPCWRTVKASGAIYVFGYAVGLAEFQTVWQMRGVKWASRIAWCYEEGARHSDMWMPKHEDCLFWRGASHKMSVPREKSAYDDPRWGEGRYMSDVWRVGRILGNNSERVDHPTQKPEQLIRVPILSSSQMGDVVLDPFSGSGTTLLAAKNLGRKAIGIELEEKYCEIAAKRLQQRALPMEFSA